MPLSDDGARGDDDGDADSIRNNPSRIDAFPRTVLSGCDGDADAWRADDVRDGDARLPFGVRGGDDAD